MFLYLCMAAAITMKHRENLAVVSSIKLTSILYLKPTDSQP